MTKRTSDMIKADLAETEIKDKDGKTIKEAIPYIDDAGRYADFHSLRHTTGSLLAASGVHPKVAQSIMRHCDINLTMSRYTHTLAGQEAKAVAGLPDLSLPSSEKQVATGTDDKSVGMAKFGSKKWTPKRTPKLTPTAFPDCNNLATAVSRSMKEQETGAKHNCLHDGQLGTKKSAVSSHDTNGAGGIRTPGTFRYNGFQDRRLKPLGHCSIYLLLKELQKIDKFYNSTITTLTTTKLSCKICVCY